VDDNGAGHKEAGYVIDLRRKTVLWGVAALAVLTGTGCVTKRQFRDNVSATDTRISGVEDSVEANERRVDDLRKETDARIGEVRGQADRAYQTGSQALTKAEEAEKAARGKILWTVTLSDDKVRFGHNMAELSPEAGAALDELAAQVKSYGKAVYLEIEGHTDNTGPEEYNFQLGEERANAVRAYLNQKGGLPLHAMSTISLGEMQPVTENSTREGRAQNRRVVVKVLE
jgi:outer membrane protein OmpA-like peptidoglycan-associated protein